MSYCYCGCYCDFDSDVDVTAVIIVDVIATDVPVERGTIFFCARSSGTFGKDHSALLGVLLAGSVGRFIVGVFAASKYYKMNYEIPC